MTYLPWSTLSTLLHLQTLHSNPLFYSPFTFSGGKRICSTYHIKFFLHQDMWFKMYNNPNNLNLNLLHEMTRFG